MINMAGRKSAASLRFGRTLRYLAAPRWSVLFFILAAAAALWVAEGGASPMVAMPLPLSLLAINLLASIATHPRFRSDLPLLFLHLALISLVSLWLVASLTYVDGAASVTRGTSFDGSLHRVDKGVWHGGGVHRLRFSNEGFVDEFPANGNEYLTYNRVRWWREDGTVQVSEIGDDLPLVLDGYRIYASGRGFAPQLLWKPLSGDVEFASIQLGGIQPDGWFDGNSSALANGPTIWVRLSHEIKRPAPGTRRLDLGASEIDSPLVIRIGEVRHELRRGQSLQLPDGSLTYVRLDAWMGYRIVNDPTTPWVLIAIGLGIVSLILFYWKKIFSGISESNV